MSLEKVWGNYFKAEMKTSGLKLFAKEKVSIATGSDTAIQAYVRATPPLKVRLTSDDIGSETFTADCSCPAAKKGQFCKHVWATLLCVELKYPDFLTSKRIIEKPSAFSDAPTETKTSFQDSAKTRAAEYRKDQYQKQKTRAKALKRERKGREPLESKSTFPSEVEGALTYFSVNGFPMPTGPSEAVLGEAKRKLSRVFHPDRGGSHDEVVELNKNCELLLRFMRG